MNDLEKWVEFLNGMGIPIAVTPAKELEGMRAYEGKTVLTVGATGFNYEHQQVEINWFNYGDELQLLFNGDGSFYKFLPWG